MLTPRKVFPLPKHIMDSVEGMKNEIMRKLDKFEGVRDHSTLSKIILQSELYEWFETCTVIHFNGEKFLWD